MTRRRFATILVVLGLASFAVALVLVHSVGHLTVQGSKSDPSDPDALAETTRVRVECASPSSGPRLNDDGNKINAGDPKQRDGVAEDDGYTLSRQEGVDPAVVSDACGRMRTERVTQAGELGIAGLLLVGWAVLLVRGGGREPAEVSAPPSDEVFPDGAVL